MTIEWVRVDKKQLDGMVKASNLLNAMILAATPQPIETAPLQPDEDGQGILVHSDSGWIESFFDGKEWRDGDILSYTVGNTSYDLFQKPTPRTFNIVGDVEGTAEYDGSNIVNGYPWNFKYNNHPITHENDECYLITTMEGVMKMTPNDMLITGVKGEIYPCKIDVFEATYEIVL